MIEFLDYDIKYPDLILDIVDYFTLRSGQAVKDKSVMKFCDGFKTPEGEGMIQPDVVAKICNRLCDARHMSCVRAGSAIGLDNNYLCVNNGGITSNQFKDYLRSYYNSLVYGFEYIYRNCLPNVIPVVAYKDGKEPMGTCFRLFNGLVTAKHCLTDGDEIAIRGYKADFLNKCKVFVSNNAEIDLAYIETGESATLYSEEPHVLDDVLVMGYPKVSFFLNFCTGEKANISAMADLRMTPTRGAITAEGEIYYPKGLPKLLLVTARIRGGNSGGPVINNHGMVVGVATGISAGEGDSDDNIGYGMAYPITAVESMIAEGNIQQFKFVDFPEE